MDVLVDILRVGGSAFDLQVAADWIERGGNETNAQTKPLATGSC
jgi:hypothetical protein